MKNFFLSCIFLEVEYTVDIQGGAQNIFTAVHMENKKNN